MLACTRPRRLVPASARSEVDDIVDILENPDRPSSWSPLHDLDMLDPFRTFPLDISKPDILLLEYYHSSFWANSYACNPEGRWMSVAWTDPAIIHATLCLVIIHRRDCLSIDISRDYFKHRGHAMKSIAGRLSDPKEAISDATIGAVAILSSSDHHFEWPPSVQETHSLGLTEMIARRGGMDRLSSNRHVQRVAGWADLLHSAMYGTGLRIKMPSRLTERSFQYFDEIAPKKSIQHAPGILWDELPSSIANILRQLRILSGIKALLLGERNVEMCQTFSDLLWKLEYAILDHHDPPDTSAEYHSGLFGCKSMVDAVGIAALLFSYSYLRDLTAPILYDKLSARLRSTLSALQEAHVLSGAGVRSLSQIYAHEFLRGDELAILLWVLNLGLQGSRTDQQSKGWFAKTMAQVCWNNGVLLRAMVDERMRSVVPQAGHAMDISEEAWTRVQGLICEDLGETTSSMGNSSVWRPGDRKG